MDICIWGDALDKTGYSRPARSVKLSCKPGAVKWYRYSIQRQNLRDFKAAGREKKKKDSA
jgi:hypothetical protein